MVQDKHNNININLSKKFNFFIGNFALCDQGIFTADKSVLQLTEELNKLKDNKEENNDNNVNYTSSTCNTCNTNITLVNKYKHMINYLKNSHKEEIDKITQENKDKTNEVHMNEIQIKEMKEII